MNTLSNNIPWFDARLFQDNQRKFPPDELLKYRGLVIAWSLDGTQILASGNDELDVAAKLKQKAIDPQKVIFANVPEGDSIIG